MYLNVTVDLDYFALSVIKLAGGKWMRGGSDGGGLVDAVGGGRVGSWNALRNENPDNLNIHSFELNVWGWGRLRMDLLLLQLEHFKMLSSE